MDADQDSCPWLADNYDCSATYYMNLEDQPVIFLEGCCQSCHKAADSQCKDWYSNYCPYYVRQVNHQCEGHEMNLYLEFEMKPEDEWPRVPLNMACCQSCQSSTSVNDPTDDVDNCIDIRPDCNNLSTFMGCDGKLKNGKSVSELCCKTCTWFG